MTATKLIQNIQHILQAYVPSPIEGNGKSTIVQQRCQLHSALIRWTKWQHQSAIYNANNDDLQKITVAHKGYVIRVKVISYKL